MLRLPLLVAALLAALLASSPLSADTFWIWGAKNNVAKQEVWFRTSFELKEVPAKALLQSTADNHCVVWLNGKQLGGSDDWAQAFSAEVGADLKAGVNTIAVLARNDGASGVHRLRRRASRRSSPSIQSASRPSAASIPRNRITPKANSIMTPLRG